MFITWLRCLNMFDSFLIVTKNREDCKVPFGSIEDCRAGEIEDDISKIQNRVSISEPRLLVGLASAGFSQVSNQKPFAVMPCNAHSFIDGPPFRRKKM